MVSRREVRIIVDTNLWISWLITKEFRKLDKIILEKNAKLVFSQELLEEFIEVANRPKLKKYFSKNDMYELMVLIDEFAHFVKVRSNLSLCRDEKDNFLLSLAVDGNASYLVTGDKDLLILGKVNDIEIITMADLLKKDL